MQNNCVNSIFLYGEYNMTIESLLKQLNQRLKPVAQELSGSEAEQIVEEITGFSRSRMYQQCGSELTDNQLNTAASILTRRLKGTPLPYVLGYAYFWDQKFKTTPSVLIPRPDTETLISNVLDHENEQLPLRVVDIGTGSGVVAQILSKEMKNWNVFATDRSYEAALIARYNCQSTVRILCMDLFEAFKERRFFDIIVSNPPYIPDSHISQLDSSVRDYEPVEALSGGPSGTDYYQYFAMYAGRLLKKGGRIYCEIGYDQGRDVTRIFAHNGWHSIKVFKDLANRPRVVSATSNGAK